MKTASKWALTVFFFALTTATGAIADGGNAKYSNSPLNSVYKLIEDEEYRKAISELTAMAEEDAKDADVWNLLGFSNRKLENYDEALKFYQKALSLKPEHKGANEYLGELYLETGKLDKARERLAVLDDACFFTCSEYRTLKKAIEKYQENNPG
ncbi:MAG: tetratricopeptide repeat protein [Gammaproteobacteria bacterium]|nr:tetratricopeptide repeat protein [Gammaproteobacteria bacterium]